MGDGHSVGLTWFETHAGTEGMLSYLPSQMKVTRAGRKLKAVSTHQK